MNSENQAPSEDMLNRTVRDFISATAARTPTPGGGSVAGVVGALGVALGEMSLNFTRGKKTFAAHEDLYAQVGPKLLRAREMFQDLVGDDMAAYKLYQTTMKMEDGPEKDEQMQVAVAAATNVPREMMKLSLAVLDDLLTLSDKCSKWLISDLVAAGVLAHAACRLSEFNVRINIPSVSDEQQGKEILDAAIADRKRAAELLEKVEQNAAEYL